jgi:hypothetical protein
MKATVFGKTVEVYNGKTSRWSSNAQSRKTNASRGMSQRVGRLYSDTYMAYLEWLRKGDKK